MHRDTIGALAFMLIMFGIGVMGMAVLIAIISDDTVTYDPLEPERFPCAEDEVLGYFNGYEDRTSCKKLADIYEVLG